jgi:hypothetical protein
MYIQVPQLVLVKILDFSLVDIVGILCMFLESNPLSSICFTDIYSSSIACFFHFVNCVLWTKVFKFDVVPFVYFFVGSIGIWTQSLGSSRQVFKAMPQPSTPPIFCLFWWHWGLNSGPHTCKAGTLTAWATPTVFSWVFQDRVLLYAWAGLD